MQYIQAPKIGNTQDLAIHKFMVTFSLAFSKLSYENKNIFFHVRLAPLHYELHVQTEFLVRQNVFWIVVYHRLHPPEQLHIVEH